MTCSLRSKIKLKIEKFEKSDFRKCFIMMMLIFNDQILKLNKRKSCTRGYWKWKINLLDLLTTSQILNLELKYK